MDKVSVGFSVFFEEPFWVGVLEREADGKLFVSKVTFGAEPKDYEVNEFLRKNYYRLRFSPAVEAAAKVNSKNPKRILREVRRQIQNTGISTKSQQALKLQQEEGKLERKLLSREAREEAEKQKFEMKQQKKKEKHRGR
ncbi:YjdF family protein [Lacrimispora sp. 38-1]|uniref:YjdF family protein n=1 Tax=Lacrimispora sp. 38-1 TaxID=3125778 RepID=UPI003CE73E8F